MVGKNQVAGELEVDAAAIPGFMDAMTMPYRLKDPSVLKNLKSGDEVKGELDVSGDGTVLDKVTVTDRSHEEVNPTPQALMKPLVPGEAVPDFTLTNQSDKTVKLSDFHGKLLLMTFIYTHCPLSDYCPRMSHYFADINTELSKNPQLYGGTHLLSVSFDPKRDTPAVLRSYGGAYTGKYTQETFDHWTFATPRESDAAALYKFFDVSSVPGPGQTLTHTLSTVEIGPDGRILKWYTGNDWTPAEVLADIHHAFPEAGA